MCNILCVDDEDNVLQFIVTALGIKWPNANITAVQSPLKGITLIESNQHFDLVITDCDMPGATGFDVIRSCITKNNSAVIMLSGNAKNLELAHEAFNDKINLQTYTKPISLNQIFSASSKALKKNRKED